MLPTATSRVQEREFYHHFIPRFILRGFKDDSQAAPETTSHRARNVKKKANRDGFINIIDLKTGELSQRLLSKEFGLVSMYRDPNAEKQEDIEYALSVLEGDAGRIISKLRKTFTKSPEATVELLRPERNTLRKFLFLMKYRNRGFYHRYNHASIEEYTAVDKERMRNYMFRKSYRSPRDVWLANLRAILALDMDAQKQWTRSLLTIMYPDDAKLFIQHAETFYLAFCRPEDPACEFLLTDNAYGVFEGPSEERVDVLHTTVLPGIRTEWHTFAPLTPSLICILRSSFLLGGDAGALAPVNELIGEILKKQHISPDSAGSYLQDLPVTRSRSLYPNGDWDESTQRPIWTAADSFSFKCFALPSRHVQLVNMVLLEEAAQADVLTYKTASAARDTIKAYLEDDEHGFKMVFDDEHPRARCIANLERALSHLGGTADRSGDPAPALPDHMAFHVGAEVGRALYEERPDLRTLYEGLTHGSEKQKYDADVLKASSLMWLWIKSDVLVELAGLQQVERNAWRSERLREMMQSPSEVFWLFLKISRNLGNFSLEDYKRQVATLQIAGPEDSILQYASRVSKVKLAEMMCEVTGWIGRAV